VPASAPTVAARAVEGRAVVEPSGAWVDIIIDGSGEVSMAACTRLLAQVTSPGAPGAHVTRPCELRPLPPVGGHGVALVTRYELDENAFALDDLLAGKRQVTEPLPFEGRRLGHEPHQDAASCQAAVAQRNDNERRGLLESERLRIAENDRRLVPAIEEQTRACKESEDAAKRCVALAGEAKTTCLLDAQVPDIVCREMTRRRVQLERERVIRPSESMTDRRCVDY
jgi:hypothetical protein